MELIDLVPEFNLYEEFWKIYTKSDIIPPYYVAKNAEVERAIISEGAEVYGTVINSVIGSGVYIGEGAVVKDSIIMKSSIAKDGAELNKAIIAENSVVGENAKLGVFDEEINKEHPDIYCHEIVTLAENSCIPPNVLVGKNVAISGKLNSGETLIKAGGLR